MSQPPDETSYQAADLEERPVRDAFSQLLKGETNFTANIKDDKLFGAYGPFYENNRFGEPGYGTHYADNRL